MKQKLFNESEDNAADLLPLVTVPENTVSPKIKLLNARNLNLIRLFREVKASVTGLKEYILRG